MSLFSSIIRNTTFPLYLKHRGEAGQLRYLKEFAGMEKLSSFDIAELQTEGMHRLLNHVYHNCEYYRNIFRDLGATPSDIETFRDLARFPILTKDLIRENMDKILAEDYPANMRARAATGGSTGQPLVFWRDYKCRDKKQAMHLNFKRWYGYRAGDRQLFFWGAQQDYDAGNSLKIRLVRNLATRCWFVNTHDLEKSHLKKTVEFMCRLKPRLVVAYPNIIYSFAKRLDEEGLRLKFKTIVCSAEQMFEYQREFLKKFFEAEVYEKYGSREIGTIASECHRHVGMHYFAPGVILETVDHDGKPAAGRQGTLLVTDLWNYAMPLIRYKVGDLVRLDHTQCACGCRLPRIGKIAGRVVDAIVKPDGETIAGQALIAVIRESEIEAQTQIIQITPEKFVINYVSENPLPQEKERFIRSSFAGIFQQVVDIEFVRKDTLERDSSGKFRYIKSEVGSPVKS